MNLRPESDKPPICRLCGQPIREGDARYREPEGDVHADCRNKARSGRARDSRYRPQQPPSYAPPPGTPVAGP